MSGRPVTFDDELQEKAWGYVTEFHTEYDHPFPSVVGLCVAIGRARRTIYDWADREDNQFSHILEAINEMQELVILHGSIKNDFNSNIAKLVLGKHGYHDKKEVKLDASEHRTSEEVSDRITDLIGSGTEADTSAHTTH